MVRLKGRRALFSGYTVRSFNSTMVRLKALENYFNAMKDAFQFHYGTIKSVCRYVLL